MGILTLCKQVVIKNIIDVNEAQGNVGSQNMEINYLSPLLF